MRDVNYEITINEHGIEFCLIVNPYSRDDITVLVKKLNQVVDDMLEVS